MNASWLLPTTLGLPAALRWAWLARRGMSPQEAYLALCGQSPSIAYFDGPGGTPAAVALGVQLAGPTGLGAALLWPLFAAAASAALYALLAPLRGPRAALAVIVLLNLLPVFNSAALTPDASMPAAMCGLAFLACAWRGLDTGRPGWWLAAGLWAAAGLLFSYLALLFLPATAIVFAASKRWRRQLLAPGLWLAAVPSLAVFALLLAWNAAHGWVHFIGGTWQTATTLDFHRLPGLLTAAGRDLSPLVPLLLAGAIILVLGRIKATPSLKFVFIPAALASIVAIHSWLRGDPSHTAALLATAWCLPLAAWWPTGTGRLPVRAAVGAVFVTAAAWTAFGLLRHPAEPPLVDAAVGREIQSLRASLTSEQPAFLIAQDAPLAAVITAHLPAAAPDRPGHPPVYVAESPFASSQYALWPRYDAFVERGTPDQPAQGGPEADPFTEQDGVNPFVGRSALYVCTLAANELPQTITAAFASVAPVAEITTPAGLSLKIYLCSDYQTLPL